MDRERELKERAQELRAVATFMKLPEARASILSMADLYDRLAEGMAGQNDMPVPGASD